MVKFATLDAEALKKADSYIPIARKSDIIHLLAMGCIENVEMSLREGNIQPIPPKWQENTLGKRLVMSYVLAGFYLHLVDVDGLYNKKNPEFNFTAGQYDTFSQLYTQLEGFKRSSDTEAKEKAFAILADYRDFEKLLNAEVYNLLQEKNDLCVRLCMMLTMQSAPESVQNAMKAYEQAKQELEAEMKRRNALLSREGKKGAV